MLKNDLKLNNNENKFKGTIFCNNQRKYSVTINNEEERLSRILDITKVFKSEDRDMGDRKSLKSVVVKWLESSSVHGLPRVVSSSQVAVKILWACIWVAAAVVFIIQLLTLINEFYSYPIKTSVNLKYHPIQFPSITFCNMNPVKRSKLDMFNNLQSVIAPKKSFVSKKKPESEEKQAPERRKRAASNITTDLETDLETYNKSTTTSSPATTTAVYQKTTTSYSDTSSVTGDTESTNTSDSSGSGSDSGSSSTGSGSGDDADGTYFYDYWATNTGSGDKSSSSSSTEWLTNKTSAMTTIKKNITEATMGAVTANLNESFVHFIYDTLQSPKDTWLERSFLFQIQFVNETIEDRRDIGHNRDDLVFGATYSGLIQNTSYFQVYTTPDYGNCYTMSSDKYQAWKSGPATGIQLTFNLEIDEYIRNFASGYGIRIVFHPPGTLPLPTEEGITLSPGFETSIGLRMVQVARLGQPYGECSDGIAFKEKYKFEYTITACMQFCRVESIISNCACFPSDGPDIGLFNTTLRICNYGLSDRVCVMAIDSGFSDGTFDCNCVSPCRDTVYEKTISGRVWPNDDYLFNVLMGEVCRKNVSSMLHACETMENNTFDYDKYKFNFLQVQIYFEDLNYENIVQEPLYEFARFLSDIGGALGLFMGGSLLSFVELPQLVLEIILYFYNRPKHRDTEKMKHNKVSTTTLPREAEECVKTKMDVHYLD